MMALAKVQLPSKLDRIPASSHLDRLQVHGVLSTIEHIFVPDSFVSSMLIYANYPTFWSMIAQYKLLLGGLPDDLEILDLQILQYIHVESIGYIQC